MMVAVEATVAAAMGLTSVVATMTAVTTATVMATLMVTAAMVTVATLTVLRVSCSQGVALRVSYFQRRIQNHNPLQKSLHSSFYLNLSTVYFGSISANIS
jgi:hypothetical protein